MRILGIDFGDRNIGLAVSDGLNITAQGLGLYRQQGKAADLAFFRSLVDDYGIGRIVVGLPLRMDGTAGTRAAKTKAFVEWLTSSLNLPVDLWDERLTTKEAFRILREQKAGPKRKKARKDQISAVIILSSYLESLR